MRQKICVLFLSLVGAAMALERNLESLQLSKASPLVMWGVIILGILVVVAVAYIGVRQHRERNAKLREHAERNFNSLARQHGLNDAEVTELKRLLKPIVPHQPDAVFSSLAVFEDAVELECKKIRGKWGLNAKAENATLTLHTLRNKVGYNNIAYEQPIASTRNMDIGQFIALSTVDTNLPIVEQAVVSENTELTFTVYYPIGDEKRNVAATKNPNANFTRNGDGLYTAQLTMVEAFPSDGKIIFEHTRDISRNQMRKYVRMVVDIPLKCRVLRRIDRSKLPATGQFLERATVVDIGGGGVAFIAEVDLDPEDVISLVFSINKRKFAVKGVVIAVSEQEGRKGTRYKHRVCFTDIDKGDVERIVKFIFQRQREQVQMLSGRKRT